MGRILSTGLLSLLALSSCGGHDKNYSSQFGYSTKIDPRDFGMELTGLSSRKIGELTIFNENFVAPPHAFFVSRLPVLNKDLSDTINQMISINVNMMEAELKPGQGFRLVGDGPSKKIKLDGLDGLSGGLQLWKYNSEKDLQADRYIGKRTLKIKAVSDPDCIYAFTFVSADSENRDFDSAFKVYEKFTGSFKRGK